MKSVFNRVCVCLLLSLVPGISAGASAEIDRALDILLKDYDLDGYLDVMDESSLNQSGFYIVQPGDTLDEIIMKLIGETPIRNRVLRDAFVQANRTVLEIVIRIICWQVLDLECRMRETYLNSSSI